MSKMGGSPGLVVMGRDSCSKDSGFKSQHCMLDGHFFTYICCKNRNVFVWKDENKRRRGRGWQTFLKNSPKIMFEIESSLNGQIGAF